MKDCSIQLTNHPGDLARVLQAFARRGVNTKAIGALTVGGEALTRILPDDISVDLVEVAFVSDNPKKAKKVLEEFQESR